MTKYQDFSYRNAGSAEIAAEIMELERQVNDQPETCSKALYHELAQLRRLYLHQLGRGL